MEQETENENSLNNENVVAQDDTASTETVDVEALKTKTVELENTNRQLFERAKKAEGFVKVDGKWVKAPKAEEAVATAQKLETTAGELEAAQLDFFDLKGYTDADEVAIFQNIMKRTGMSHREVIKDEYALSKVEAIRKDKQVKNAMPSSTKRTGQTETNDVDFHLARYEASGELPKDFAMRAKVIEAKAQKSSDTVPPWRR
jgi:hypothetical protein